MAAKIWDLTNFCIGVLPVHNTAADSVTQAELVATAAALAVTWSYAMDALLDKAFGENRPSTAVMPTVSACLSFYGHRALCTTVLLLSCMLKGYITVFGLLAIPSQPIPGPLPVPDIPTPRWRPLTGAGLGVGADAVIAILPHYDARSYPWEHAARVVVAVAVAACGIDGIDGLVAKIFGPNQPRTAHFPSVSSCLSRYKTSTTWMLGIVLSFLAKAVMTELAFQAIPALPVQGPIPVDPTPTLRPVWVAIARLGHLSELCVGVLPVCNSAAHPVAQAVIIVAAAALAAAGSYGIDRLVQKIYGQNNPWSWQAVARPIRERLPWIAGLMLLAVGLREAFKLIGFYTLARFAHCCLADLVGVFFMVELPLVLDGDAKRKLHH